MLKQLLNECNITLDIVPKGSILIKGPDVEKEKSESDSGEPDMKFVTIRRNSREEPYLPGGSLKGVMRSQGEKIARSLASSFGCCNPFWTYNSEGRDGKIPDTIKDEISCSDKLEILSKKGPEVYKLSCPICRLFGNSSLGSRLAVEDAYLSGNTQSPLPYRDGVAIDRFTGGAKGGAKFRYEVLEKGKFTMRIRIRNFELWQLGLLAYILKDMSDGLIRIGFGKRRGLGKIQGSISSVEISYLGSARPDWKTEAESFELWGVGEQLDGTGAAYGYITNDVVGIPLKPEFHNNFIRATVKIDLDILYHSTTNCWNSFIEKYSLPVEMTYQETKKVKEGSENAENV